MMGESSGAADNGRDPQAGPFPDTELSRVVSEQNAADASLLPPPRSPLIGMEEPKRRPGRPNNPKHNDFDSARIIVRCETERKRAEKADVNRLAEEWREACACAKKGRESTDAWIDDLRAKDPSRADVVASLIDDARRNPKIALPGVQSASIDSRPTILVSADADQVIDQTIATLARDPEIYKRNFALVCVKYAERVNKDGELERTPTIFPLCPASLLPILTRCARFVEVKTNRQGNPVFDEEGAPALRQIIPPTWLVNGVNTRMDWPQLRRLDAIVEAPILRHDGTVLDTPGYDERTGILYIPTCDFPEVADRPTREDALAAKDLILQMIKGFPFADDINRAACVAAILSPAGQFMVAGEMPFFLMNASIQGSGKGLICNVIGQLYTGRGMALHVYTDDANESRKTMLSIANDGSFLVQFDEIDKPLGGGALQAALTSDTITGRLLNTNTTRTITLNAIFFGTGNTVQVDGDMNRRVIPIRIVPRVENPEETKFEIPNLRIWARQHRPQLVHAILTILRAYMVAGMPCKGAVFGSYQEWSDLIAGAVTWTMGINPIKARESLNGGDKKKELAQSIIEGLYELPLNSQPKTLKEVIKILDDNPNEYEMLRDAFCSMSWNGDMPKAERIGTVMSKHLDRTIGGKRLVQCGQARPGQKRWLVEVVDASFVERNLDERRTIELAQWLVMHLLSARTDGLPHRKLGDLLIAAGEAGMLDEGPDWDVTWIPVMRKAKALINSRQQPLPPEARKFEVNASASNDGLESGESWMIQDYEDPAIVSIFGRKAAAGG